jgi:pyruvate dehydrogenase E2 component (dihydrolipoamide acetyltransferase)
MDMATGKIAKWHVKEGDTVKKGALLFEIETDKASMEIDSGADGIIRNITAAEGAVVTVGVAVAYIYQEGEATSKPAVKVSPAPVEALQPVTRSDAGQFASLTSPASGHFRGTPLAKRLARLAGLAIENIKGSGPNGRVVAADVEAILDQPKPTVQTTGRLHSASRSQSKPFHISISRRHVT